MPPSNSARPGIVIRMTSAVAVSIHAVSPLSTLGLAGSAAALTASAAGLSGVAAGLSCASVTPATASDSTRARNAQNFFIGFSSECRRIGLAGADADDFFQIEHEDLAVADLAGIGRALDRLDRLLEQFRLDRGLDLHLGQEIDDVLRAAIKLGVAFLPAEALHLRDGDSLHADRRERFSHLVELERLDDCGDQFHKLSVSEGLHDREHDRALPRLFDASAATSVVISFVGVAIHVSRSEDPATQVVGHAELPILVVELAVLLYFEHPVMRDNGQLLVDREGGVEVQVPCTVGTTARAERYAGILVRDPASGLLVGQTEIVRECVEELAREPLPAG